MLEDKSLFQNLLNWWIIDNSDLIKGIRYDDTHHELDYIELRVEQYEVHFYYYSQNNIQMYINDLYDNDMLVCSCVGTYDEVVAELVKFF